MRMILALGFAVALSGCAASGARFKDHKAYTEPVPVDQARVVVYRLDKAQNTTAVATTEIDGLVFGSLRENGFVWHGIDTATHVLRVDIPNEPGTCLLTFRLAAGETGYFLVVPRVANAVARTPGSILETVLDALSPNVLVPLIGRAATNVGATLEAAGKRCGGPFSVTQVPPAAAQPQVMDLRESK